MTKPPRPLAIVLPGVLLGVLAVSLPADSQLPASAKRRPLAAGSHSSIASQPIIFVQAPAVASNDLRNRYPQGSRLVRTTTGTKPGGVVSLTPEFFAAADPQVSFDAARVLFAAQRDRASTWQIWEMNIDGSAMRQITHLGFDCLRPAYLAHEEFAFTAITGQAVSQVYVANLDGSEAHPITFGPGNFQLETVMNDGRILVSAASPLAPGTASGGLYVMRHDGTGFQSLRCEHRQPVRRAQAAELADGSVVFIKNTPAETGVGGELAMIRRGALHNSSLSPVAATAFSPRPLEAGKLIVARNNTAAADPKFDLYAFDAASGKFGELIYRDPKLSSVEAVPIAARPTPRWYWSTLNPQAKAGYFVCLDAYHSADEADGRIATPIARVRVLILEGHQERSLGEAVVETDGSFYIGVPPDQPVRFELLDASGKVIRAQQSWIWSRPGEERGCVGCHEDKSVAPDNRWPLALKRFDTPARLGVEPELKAAH